MASPAPPGDVDTTPGEVLKFEPWQSAVDPGFWAELARRKLDTFGLSEVEVPIHAKFRASSHAEVSSPVSLDKHAFDDWSVVANDASATGHLKLPGTLRNVNTFERFKEMDRKEMLDSSCGKIWNAVANGDALTNPNVLNSFTLLTFADLKKWHFTYWFGFPAVKVPKAVRVVGKRKLREMLGDHDKNIESSKNLEAFTKSSDEFAWTVVTNNDTVQCYPLREYNALLQTHSPKNVHVAFSDPCANPDHPGWAARNLLTLASLKLEVGESRTLNLISVRKRNGTVSLEHSVVFQLVLPDLSGSSSDPKCPFSAVGWELNPKGRAGPRRADLGESMDPVRLAISAAELNLKLMRWRLLPELDLGKISNTKCLLIGAGTLGCSVARCLLGWGVRNFTFVDNGKVSFSNPVRQSLFEFEDCLGGGKLKAECAADALKRIFPNVIAVGVEMSIPMPGHPVVGDEEEKRVLQDVSQLEELIRSHDVVFCLTDTRESRWLPTLISSATGTLLINAALGFDGYLVMRHGLGGESSDKDEEAESSSNKEKLGCYFCNDVMAPGNSTNDRTLDQQCTVTRPGLAPIAGALAAEMCVAYWHYKGKGEDVPAETGNACGTNDTNHTTCLGIVPHQIRGHVSTYVQTLFNAPAFGKCTACSATVTSAFNSETTRNKFLLSAFADPTFLEDKTGLTLIHQEADAAAWLNSDDDEDDF
tara:strand:+ start:18175 stop:20286 length:2112 start_codon:yes stop_codon:yes gene_type:complete